MNELAKNIKELRTKIGLKQNDLANALNVSPQAVSKWETGENYPDISLMPSIAKYLNTSIDRLFGFSLKENQTIEASILVTNICGYFEKSKELDLKDLVTSINAHYYQLTETILKYNGIPVKYFGNEVLCFFTGENHKKRALQAVLNIIKVVPERMTFGIGCGDVYLGKFGHPDYEKMDVVGEPVSEAYHSNMWAKNNAKTGIGASRSYINNIELNIGTHDENFCEIVNFK